MKTKLLPIVLSLALTLGFAGICLALDPGEERIIELISDEYNLTQNQILDLVDLGYGYGEITIAASLADAAEVPLSDILAEAESGLSWGEIASLLGIQNPQLGQNVRQLFAQGTKKTGNKDLDWEEALVQEMLQTRLREQTQLHQSDPAATNSKLKVSNTLENSVQQKAADSGKAKGNPS